MYEGQELTDVVGTQRESAVEKLFFAYRGDTLILHLTGVT